jgi:hypothetical protein
MRSEEEIRKAIQDYATCTMEEYIDKYHLNNDLSSEVRGFVKALRWVLGLT